MKPEMKLIEGGRAKLEMEILFKIAEPRNIPEQELQELLAPLKKRSNLSIVSNSYDPSPPSAKSG